MKAKAKAIVKTIVTLLIIAFMAWVLISWYEVRAHNEAMLYGNEHEYSEANFFVLYNDILRN